MSDNVTDARVICVDALHRMMSPKVVPSARHTVKMELRRNVIDRLVKDRQKDVDFSVGVILEKEMQDTLAKYLAALSKKSK